MKTVRFIASILFYISRACAVLFLITALYAAAVTLSFYYSSAGWLPITTEDGHFTIFYPFTEKPFLLGDYTFSYLFTYLFTVAFYGLFLWLLSGVFQAFKQQKLFTKKGVVHLSRFYITNLLMPLLFLVLFFFFRDETTDIMRIMLLHLVIGVFAFFMAAIFKQGLVLQDEQDLTF
jgi:hypothetical protein